MLSTAYFFGCWREAGHYLWRPGMDTVQLPAGWTWAIDGHYVPHEPGIVNHVITRGCVPIPAGWTVLSMIDNTVDHRPGRPGRAWMIRFQNPLEEIELRTQSRAIAKKIALKAVLRRSLEEAGRANAIAALASSFLRESEMRQRDRQRKAGA